MWVLYAFASAFFAGITAILAKIGIEKTDSNVVTAIRTTVVVLFAWLLVALQGTFDQLSQIDLKTLLFLVLSGFTTGASWICYFKALQLSDVNKVVPIDKTSTILTMLLAFLFLHENFTLQKGICMIMIGMGTYMMIEKKPQASKDNHHSWLLYALGSSLFAALTSILGKIGIQNIDANLGTAIRTVIVFMMAWGIVFTLHRQKEIAKINQKSWLFIILSGFATGLSWLCYYHALQMGDASIVVPIDKLSIVVTIAFASLILKEKLTRKGLLGFGLIIIGTLCLLW